MAFTVQYTQDTPNNCWECPCSVSVTHDSVFCHALKRNIHVNSEMRPEFCTILEVKENLTEAEEFCKDCINFGGVGNGCSKGVTLVRTVSGALTCDYATHL